MIQFHRNFKNIEFLGTLKPFEQLLTFSKTIEIQHGILEPRTYECWAQAWDIGRKHVMSHARESSASVTIPLSST